jgi:predicted PurR-regulated permease PerM
MSNASRQSRFVTALFLIVFTLAVAAMFQLLAVYVTSIVFALVLVVLFAPVHTRIEKRLGGKARVAAGITTAIAVLVVVLPLGFISASLSAEAFALYERMSTDEAIIKEFQGVLSGESVLGQKIREYATRANIDLSPARLSEYAQEVGKSVGLFLYEQVGGVASNAFAFLMNFGMMLIFLFVFLSEGAKLKDYLLDLSPLPDDEEEMLADRFSSIARAVFLGNGLGSGLQGLVGGLSFYLFGIGSGVLWGAAIAFFAFLPMVGASVVLVPAAAYLFIIGETGNAIGFLAFNAVQVGVLEYGVKTRLIGGSSQMNGVLVFVGIVAGLSVYGLMGLFYGPLVLTMFLTLAEIYKDHYRANLMQATIFRRASDFGEAASDASAMVEVLADPEPGRERPATEPPGPAVPDEAASTSADDEEAASRDGDGDDASADESSDESSDER